MNRRRLNRAASLALATIALASCKPSELQLDAPRVAGDAPTRQQIITAHNQRAARLATTHSDGVVELRWKDREGDHFDQGDLELWQTTENRTAMRVSKLGEVLLWLGSDKDQWWLFNDRESTLIHGAHDQAGERFGAVGVSPLALLDLMGLTAIDENASSDAPPAYDKTLKSWVIEASGRGGKLRIAFDQATLLPKRIELLDAGGAIAAESTLSRFESVALPGVAIMARPKMPKTIDIHRGPRDDGSLAGDVKIALNETSGQIDEKAAANIFDLQRLTASMKPQHIEHAADGG